MAEANIRYDGSDYFPSGKRWGHSFRFSGMGCIRGKILERLGAEKDFDQFKLRASYGEIGQDFLDLNGDYVADRFAYVSSYTLYTRGAFLGEKWYPSFSEGALISPDMTWYTTKDFNLGIDFSSLNSRLSVR